MATKTFKIGLSATDKQNMAQYIYEQVEDLLFEEYDSSETYNTNDYVVYSGVLYRALEDNITGTWDNTKWQTATLNDLVDEVNSAVASVDNKASVNGNYPTMTVGLADNLTPYGEDSGAEQDNPFISNGTGTNNNTEIVTSGDYGLLREKQGNTLVVNQIVANSDLTATTSQNDITITNNNNGTLTISGTSSDFVDKNIVSSIQFIQGHKYLIYTNLTGMSYNLTNGYTLYVYGTNVGTLNDIRNLLTPSANGAANIYFKAASGITINQTIWVRIINLTQMFNGDIPQDLLDNPSHFSWYYNGDLSYDTGSLENANGVKLVSTGRNLWDEEWEVGLIDNTTGQNESNANAIRSKNYINIVPNTDYYFKVPIGTSNWFRVCWYDKNKTFISGLQTTSFIQKSPANAYYMRFCSNGTYGNTYLNDITISLYYTPEQGGEGYNTYYPYEEPNVIDTGSEVLRSAGSVKDYKEPNGTIHRLVGVVDLGSLEWTYYSAGGIFYVATSDLPTSYKQDSTNGTNVLCSIYSCSAKRYMGSGDKVLAGYDTNSGKYLVVRDSAYSSASDFKTAMSGVYLFYELATPTTEQGTAFTENLPINDYGMLYWLDENDNLVDVPQGAKIFFPTNYKGFIDDMYSRVEGDSSAYALNSELNTKFETYLKSLSGYDETKTQTLKNVSGTLTWVDDE